jgi:hypothetical protein
MIFDDPLFFQELATGNEGLYLNYHEDMITSLLTSSWNVFEQITKDLTATDHSTQPVELSVCYTNGSSP